MQAVPHPFTRLTSKAAWSIVMLLSVAIAVYSYRYLPGIGPRPPQILANAFARPWLFIHVAGAATALLIGPFQFLRGLRSRRPLVHRVIGRTYVAACLVGGVGGFVAAFGSFAGPVATLGFGSLAVCWLGATVLAWRRAVQRRYDDHRRWMIRSWAMTFAAVTLRLYLPLIPLFGVSFVEGYRAISWLCWIGDLVVAEAWLRLAKPPLPAFRPSAESVARA